MVIGTCRITLRLPENHSLKGKRQIVKSLLGRVRGRFDVAAAEVEDNDSWQLATLGFACVSNNARHANEIMDHVIDFVQGSHLDAEILEVQLELVYPF